MAGFPLCIQLAIADLSPLALNMLIRQLKNTVLLREAQKLFGGSAAAIRLAKEAGTRLSRC